jgi:hypothetical protein
MKSLDEQIVILHGLKESEPKDEQLALSKPSI